MKQEMTGWHWHQLDFMQIICTSLQMDNHSSISRLYILTGRTLFLTPHQQFQGTEGITHAYASTTTTTVLRPFFRDHRGELVPEENFWTLWCKGRLTEADTPTIRLGGTLSGLTSAHLHHPPYFLQAGCPSCRPTNSVKALKATSTFGLGRRCYSSPQQCYLQRLRTTCIHLSPLKLYL